MGGSSSAPAIQLRLEKCNQCKAMNQNLLTTNCSERLCIACVSEHLLVDDPSCVPCLSENSSEPQEFWKVSNRLARLKSELEGAKSAILKLNGEKAILRHESDAGRQRHAECFGELLKVKQANASLMKLLADTQMQLQQSQVALRQAHVEQEYLRMQINSSNVLLKNQSLEIQRLKQRSPPSNLRTANVGPPFKVGSRRGIRRTLAGRNVEECIANIS